MSRSASKQRMRLGLFGAILVSAEVLWRGDFETGDTTQWKAPPKSSSVKVVTEPVREGKFPEAEFQRGNALVSLGRFSEAEAAFQKAISYKKNWSLPYSALGALLMRQDRDKDAEQFFRQGLAVDSKDGVALRLLSEIRLRAGDAKEARVIFRLAGAQSGNRAGGCWRTLRGILSGHRPVDAQR